MNKYEPRQVKNLVVPPSLFGLGRKYLRNAVAMRARFKIAATPEGIEASTPKPPPEPEPREPASGNLNAPKPQPELNVRQLPPDEIPVPKAPGIHGSALQEQLGRQEIPNELSHEERIQPQDLGGPEDVGETFHGWPEPEGLEDWADLEGLEEGGGAEPKELLLWSGGVLSTDNFPPEEFATKQEYEDFVWEMVDKQAVAEGFSSGADAEKLSRIIREWTDNVWNERMGGKSLRNYPRKIAATPEGEGIAPEPPKKPKPINKPPMPPSFGTEGASQEAPKVQTEFQSTEAPKVSSEPRGMDELTHGPPASWPGSTPESESGVDAIREGHKLREGRAREWATSSVDIQDLPNMHDYTSPSAYWDAVMPKILNSAIEEGALDPKNRADVDAFETAIGYWISTTWEKEVTEPSLGEPFKPGEETPEGIEDEEQIPLTEGSILPTEWSPEEDERTRKEAGDVNEWEEGTPEGIEEEEREVVDPKDHMDALIELARELGLTPAEEEIVDKWMGENTDEIIGSGEDGVANNIAPYANERDYVTDTVIKAVELAKESGISDERMLRYVQEWASRFSKIMWQSHKEDKPIRAVYNEDVEEPSDEELNKIEGDEVGLVENAKEEDVIDYLQNQLNDSNLQSPDQFESDNDYADYVVEQVPWARVIKNLQQRQEIAHAVRMWARQMWDLHGGGEEEGLEDIEGGGHKDFVSTWAKGKLNPSYWDPKEYAADLHNESEYVDKVLSDILEAAESEDFSKEQLRRLKAIVEDWATKQWRKVNGE